MKRVLGFIGTFAILGFAFPSQLVIEPDSRVWVEGTSTVRDFTCTAAAVEGTIESGSGAPTLETIGTAVAAVHVRIAVPQLACGNGTMDGHMKKALKATEHELIEFRMSSYRVTGVEAGRSTLELEGTLLLAGEERPVVLEAAATQDEDGALRVAGKHTLAMTDWGVKPPSLMLGTMKVRDEVVVNFDIRLRER